MLTATEAKISKRRGRLSLRYTSRVWTGFAILTLLIGGILYSTYSSHYRREMNLLSTLVDERAEVLKDSLARTSAYTQRMKLWMESYLRLAEKDTTSPLHKDVIPTSDGDCYYLGKTEGVDKTDRGTLIGTGRIEDMDDNQRAELNMALALFGMQKAAHATIPFFSSSYYLSNTDLLTVYPEVLSLSDNTLSDTSIIGNLITEYRNSEIWTRGTPEKNRMGISFWTAARLGEQKDIITSHAAPVFHNGNFSGIVAVDLKLNFLEESVRLSYHGYGRFIILNHNDEVLAASGWKSHNRIVKLNDFVDSKLKNERLSEIEGISFAPQKRQGFTIFGREIESSGWMILYIIPDSEITAQAMPDLTLPLALLVVLGLVLLLSNITIRRKYIKPAIALVDYVRTEVYEGDSSIPEVPEEWLGEFETISEMLSLRAVTDNLPGAILRILESEDGKFTIDYLNVGASELFFPPDESVLETPVEAPWFIPADAREDFRNAIKLARTLRERLAFEFQIFMDNDIGKWARLTATPRASGEGGTIWDCILLDITPLKRIEENLKKIQATLIETEKIANVGSWFWNIRTNEVFRTDELYRIFGIRRSDERTDAITMFNAVHPQDRRHLEDAINTSVENAVPFDIEYRITRPDGEERIVHHKAEVQRDQSDRVYKFTGTVQDITNRKKLEDKAGYSSKMQAIGQLAGGIAHDFNNQLTGIAGYAQMILRTAKEEAITTFAEKIIETVKKSADLNSRLLAFARRGNYRWEPTDINASAITVMTLLKHSIDKRTTVTSEFSGAPLIVSGDPSQIQTALLNIAINAQESISGKGSITFRTYKKLADAEFCENSESEIAPGDYAAISIEDTGHGMSSQEMERMFEPFFTTKKSGEGVGMGLSAAYGIVKNHNGAIYASSIPGEGTSFTILLPLSDDKIETRQKTSDTGIRKTQGRILIVDDEQIIRSLLCDFLKRKNHETIACCNGLEGLETYREKWNEIDLVIIDMIMPRMCGPEAFAEMKKINPKVKVIFLSAMSDENEMRTLLQEGAADFVQKPFDFLELIAKINLNLSD